jgi:membrane fusion protein, heavy metal efflux system
MMLIRMLMIATSILALSGCNGGDPKPTASVPTPIEATAEEAEDGVVTLPRESQREVGISVQEVAAQALPEVIRATGRVTINENETWRVGAVTDGRIVHIYAREGDQVENGQILARMHSHDIHESRAEYMRAVAELDRLKAGRVYAQSVRDRTHRLHQLKAGSIQQVEQAEAELLNAETAVAHGEVELERTEIHLVDFLGIPAEDPTPHEHTGEHAEVDLIPIKAPAAGTLLKRNVTAGTVVEPTHDLFVITDLSTLWTMAAVSEDYLSKLRIGMPVKIYVQAYPDRAFSGRLTKLDTALDPTTRTIMARVEVPNRGGLLKPEMYTTAEMELNGTREAVFVPEIAVQEVDGEPTVFVQTAPDSFEPRTVATAPGVGGNLEVLHGLRAGDKVVVEGSFLLKSQLLKSTLAEE